MKVIFLVKILTCFLIRIFIVADITHTYSGGITALYDFMNNKDILMVCGWWPVADGG